MTIQSAGADRLQGEAETTLTFSDAKKTHLSVASNYLMYRC